MPYRGRRAGPRTGLGELHQPANPYVLRDVAEEGFSASSRTRYLQRVNDEIHMNLLVAAAFRVPVPWRNGFSDKSTTHEPFSTRASRGRARDNRRSARLGVPIDHFSRAGYVRA